MSDHDFGAAHLAIHGHPQAPVPPPDLHPNPAPAARPLQHAASNSEARKRDDAATCLVCGNSVAVEVAIEDARAEGRAEGLAVARALGERVEALSRRFRQGGDLGISDTCADVGDMIAATIPSVPQNAAS